jgi:hypothetical protein
MKIQVGYFERIVIVLDVDDREKGFEYCRENGYKLLSFQESTENNRDIFRIVAGRHGGQTAP